GDVAGTARTVDGEDRRVPCLKLFAHAHQRAHSSAGTRSAHRPVAKLGEDAGDVLAVKAAADHHRHLLAAKTKSGGDNATMPETPDSIRRSPAVAQAVWFADHGEAQGGADPADEQVSRPGDPPEQETLAKRKLPLAGRIFRARFELRR